MYSWIIKRVVTMLYGMVSRGDLRLPLLGLADDAVLDFPGASSFGGEHRGKPAIAAWMRRFASLRPEFRVHDASAAGMPWDMRVFMRFSDRIVAPNGYVYENDGMEYILIKRGLIREIRVHLDTEKVAALDAQLGTGDQAVSTSDELAS
ncbi:MAG: nuclear transport factor 2 family protein [Solirubrobacteraceae bacterium]